MFMFEELRDSLACIRIAHHIRGRIRLKLATDSVAFALPDKHTRQFQTILGRTPGVHSVRINLPARSCAVEYDPTVIAEQAWSDFLTGTNSAAAILLEQSLRNTCRELSNAKL